MSKYIKADDYEEPQMPKEPGDIVYQACCDCGLVHVIAWFEHVDTGKLKMLTVRDERRTAQLRRNEYGSLHNGSGKWRMIRR